jgi:RimJ/RimL family protein N-acetyltransferase
MSGEVRVALRRYAEGDLWLLQRTLGDPAQMIHLNGPESDERLQRRHTTFVAMSASPDAGCQFMILVGGTGTPAGNVGFWESEWRGEKAWEMGWFVLPEFQGRGVATAATRLVIDSLVPLPGPRSVVAFPSVDNHASNAICRRLGFTLKEDVSSEYPAGSGRTLHVNVWMLSLPVPP